MVEPLAIPRHRHNFTSCHKCPIATASSQAQPGTGKTVTLQVPAKLALSFRAKIRVLSPHLLRTHLAE